MFNLFILIQNICSQNNIYKESTNKHKIYKNVNFQYFYEKTVTLFTQKIINLSKNLTKFFIIHLINLSSIKYSKFYIICNYL